MLMQRPEGKKLLGWPRHRWQDNIKMNHKVTEWDGVDLIKSGSKQTQVKSKNLQVA